MATVDFLLDTETLGTDHDALVLNLGIVPFNIDGKDDPFDLLKRSLTVRFDKKQLFATKRFSYTDDTKNWWKKQPQEVQDLNLKATPDDVSLQEGCQRIIDYLKENGYSRKSTLWTRGLDFDIPIVKNLFNVSGLDYPFNPFMSRDVRTFLEVLTGEDSRVYRPKGFNEKLKDFPKHFSTYDAIRDVIFMQMAFNDE
jgi:exonuclease A|nr:MAG TPA: exonuclease [Caudoviricetes sp.]